MSIPQTNACSRASLDSTMVPVNKQVSTPLLQSSIGHANLPGLAKVHHCNSLLQWNSCLNITAPKVNIG